MLQHFCLLILLSCLLLITGCEEYTNPELTSLRLMFQNLNPYAPDPARQSIRLSIWQNGQSGYVQLHLINIVHTPDSAHKPYIRLGWYSPNNVNLELCEGQLCGSSGSTQAWRDVVIQNLPNIDQLLAGKTIDWHRTYIAMPDYRWTDQSLRTEPESNPEPKHLQQLQRGDLRWFKTYLIHNPDKLPNTLLGIDPKSHEVVYSDTCLSATYCFSWQTWASSLAGSHS